MRTVARSRTPAHWRGAKATARYDLPFPIMPRGCNLILGMEKKGSLFGARSLQRFGAVLLTLAVLYFAAGGSFLHRHTGGQETVCHVCQSLHAPALATATGLLVAAPEVTGWQEAPPIQASALNEVSLHHAGRAPPCI